MDPRPTLLQAESSGWLFKSPLAWGGGILWQHHYRPHSLLLFRIIRLCSPAFRGPHYGMMPSSPLSVCPVLAHKSRREGRKNFRFAFHWHPILDGGKKVKVTWTGWIFESTQHWFTSLYATYPRKRATWFLCLCYTAIYEAHPHPYIAAELLVLFALNQQSTCACSSCTVACLTTPLNETSTNYKISVAYGTLSLSPSGDDTVGTISDRSIRETDRLDEIVVRQRARQAYYSDVKVIVSVYRVALV